jgi:hypothetical protein
VPSSKTVRALGLPREAPATRSSVWIEHQDVVDGHGRIHDRVNEDTDCSPSVVRNDDDLKDDLGIGEWHGYESIGRSLCVSDVGRRARWAQRTSSFIVLAGPRDETRSCSLILDGQCPGGDVATRKKKPPFQHRR